MKAVSVRSRSRLELLFFAWSRSRPNFGRSRSRLRDLWHPEPSKKVAALQHWLMVIVMKAFFLSFWFTCVFCLPLVPSGPVCWAAQVTSGNDSQPCWLSRVIHADFLTSSMLIVSPHLCWLSCVIYADCLASSISVADPDLHGQMRIRIQEVQA